MSDRHIARAITLQVLFMWDFNGEDDHNVDFYIDYNVQEFAPEGIDRGFITGLAKRAIAYKPELDQLINKYTKEWPVDRLTVVDRNILRIALYEMFHMDDIPIKVALNEAVELAKEYSGSSSQKFVSGILGSIYDDFFKNKTS